MLTTEYNLPIYKEIIDLEKLSYKEGSGINVEDLLGIWRFQYVWKKGQSVIDNVSSSILQVISASLELSNLTSKEDAPSFEISNSVRIGILTIIFSGKAFLKGNRPLLPFYFKNLVIKIGNISILKKSFEDLELKKMPFFSLIAIGENKKWMCARGKGGGLAIWIKK